MQAGEDWVACSPRARGELEKLLSCLGVPRSLEDLGLGLLCRRRDNGVEDIYALSRPLAAALAGLPDAARGALASVGVHVARLRQGRLIPLLGLCSLLARHRLRPSRGLAVVGEKGEKLFLYGRDVLPESILRYTPMPGVECSRYPVLVANARMEPLGWGRSRRRRDRIYIENIVDAGWYLRSGV
ncbi:hypothetical protein CF15_02355 [Pyrodictium occultum]|uniref:UPF0113 domain-containing protein n=1 Tax=Pyrodictium occultum TaxID=2309 RepID=A0A0V8RUD6_PYROC|nr:hypothetical protein [Pyrodictium occultum]KSW11681.1 hypothetical protein CF15_02355 [Pyrodictium occultum]